jgi:hypothetical protein
VATGTLTRLGHDAVFQDRAVLVMARGGNADPAAT